MGVKKKNKPGRDGWKALLKTVARLRLPWIWVAAALALNMVLNNLMLNLPDTTAELMSGQLNKGALMKAILYYVMMAGLSFVMVAGQAQAQSYSVKRSRDTLWKKMLGTRMDYFDKNDPSDLMSTIINDAGSAVLDLVNIIIYFIPQLYYVIMALLKINKYHWILAVSCFAMIPLKFFYAWIMGRKFQTSSAHLYNKVGVLTGYLADRISHLPLIKVYTNERQEKENGHKAAGDLLKANMKIVHLDNIAASLVSAMDVIQKFIVIVVAVVLLQQKKIDLKMWVAFFLFSQNLFSYMDYIFDTWVRMKTVHGTFHRVIGIMEAPGEEDGQTLKYPDEGDIAFNNVTFAYPESDRPALENVSFSIKRGSSVAIVGLCGSGKTTTVSMLERLYLPDEGNITIGGIDIKNISLRDYRQHLSYVQQGTEIFSGTLREALTYGLNTIPADEKIIEAAKKTGFDQYLSRFDNNLDIEIMAGGESMSGGQCQRLVLTREFLRGGDIIIMDEPTSALDVMVSSRIQETVDELFDNKTRILITHDLEMAKTYDRILVMENGKLVGDGSHDELMNNCEMYREMNEGCKEEVTR